MLRSVAIVLLAGCIHTPSFNGVDDAGSDVDGPSDVPCHGNMTITDASAFTLDSCVTYVMIEAIGGSGGGVGAGTALVNGGVGGHVIVGARLDAERQFSVTTGKAGVDKPVDSGGGSSGGFGVGRGGAGGKSSTHAGAGGGGASSVYLGSDRIVVAAGGGGATFCQNGPVSGGAGGTNNGDAGIACDATATVPTGGSGSGAGVGGMASGCIASSGSGPDGGNGCEGTVAGGGGGGGYWGGGGGAASGGAGGSNFPAKSGATVSEHATGHGSGSVVLTW